MKSLFFVLILSVCSPFVLAGCSDKKSADTAAIRALLEKQEADKEKQKQSDKEYMDGVKKGGAAPIRKFKY